ncbi:MAG TPA: cell envelope integrity protein TolA [Pseudomonas sp.]|nr:cell envelope integrity protein TolA [Pseudomonas sp.]
MRPVEPSASSPWFWPLLGAVSLHLALFGLLFVSFSSTPDLPPARPVVQATLYELKSRSQAESQTQQKIAGEAQKTAARESEMEQLRQRRAEEQRVAAAKAEAEKKAAEQKRKAEAEKRRQAEVARKKAEDEARKKAAAEAARKKAEEEKARQAAEARKKAAEQEAALKVLEERRAQALKELLSDELERQSALAEEAGEQVMGNIDDLLQRRAAQNWSRPPSARSNMVVELRVTMLPDGTITNASVSKSSGDVPFDTSAVAAVRNIGRVAEVQSLTPQQFERRYRSFTMIFTPEDLSL